MDYQDVFERYEYKYFLTPSQKRKLLELSEGRLELDRYGRTTIRNIYYDTDSFRLIRDSLDHPVYKEKLRLRSYQKASDNDPVFIEIKKKYEDIVYKRRIAIPKTSAENWIDSRKPMPFRTQITSEIDYFLEFYEGIFLNGSVQFDHAHANERTAFLARTETDGSEQSIQSQSRHQSSSDIIFTILLRTKPSSGSSPVLRILARRRQNVNATMPP